MKKEEWVCPKCFKEWLNISDSDDATVLCSCGAKCERMSGNSIRYDTDNDRTANQYAQADNINHPEHYAGPIECIDAMIAAYGKDQVAIFCKICAFKYLWRLEKKGDSSVDAGKAQWYLDKYKEMKR